MINEQLKVRTMQIKRKNANKKVEIEIAVPQLINVNKSGSRSGISLTTSSQNPYFVHMFLTRINPFTRHCSFASENLSLSLISKSSTIKFVFLNSLQHTGRIFGRLNI